MIYNYEKDKRIKGILQIGLILIVCILILSIFIHPVNAIGLDEIKRQPVLISNNLINISNFTGSSDHHALTNLTGYDDHIQYALRSIFSADSTSNSLFAGISAGSNKANQVAIGNSAGAYSSGELQLCLGTEAGIGNSGYYQTAVGTAAGISNTGHYQTVLGGAAGIGNTGVSETALGFQAGAYNDGVSLLALGGSSGYNNSGNNNIFIGFQSGEENIKSNYFELKQNSVNIVPLISGDLLNGKVGINTNDATAPLDVNGNAVRIRNSRTIINGTTICNTGEISWTTAYLYLCTNTNVWKRVELQAI